MHFVAYIAIEQCYTCGPQVFYVNKESMETEGVLCCGCNQTMLYPDRQNGHSIEVMKQDVQRRLQEQEDPIFHMELE